LLRSWTDGTAKIDGFLEDYGALGNALLTVYETTLDPRWLAEICWCAEAVMDRFRGPEDGLLYDSASDAPPLVIRPRDAMDSATPSGTSLAIELLQRASRLFGEAGWSEAANTALRHESENLRKFPSAFGRMLSLTLAETEGLVEVALVGPAQDPRFQALHAAVLARYLPTRVMASRAEEHALTDDIPLLEGRGATGDTPAVFLCRDQSCLPPITDVALLNQELDSLIRGT